VEGYSATPVRDRPSIADARGPEDECPPEETCVERQPDDDCGGGPIRGWPVREKGERACAEAIGTDREQVGHSGRTTRQRT